MLLSLFPRSGWLSCECVLCQAGVAGSRPLCRACEKSLSLNSSCCACCAMPLMIPASHCAQCLQYRPHFTQAFSAFRYDASLGHLLNRFKHEQDLACGNVLATLALKPLTRQLKQQLARPDYVLPVPLNRRRQQQRGFNQAHEIAKVWSRELKLPLLNCVTRRKATQPLQQLDRRARGRAVRDAFVLTGMPPAAHIALIDDVLTTGATANEIASLLYAFGVKRVDVWTVARVP